MDLAVDLGRVALCPALGGARSRLIDHDRQALADLVLEFSSADFLAALHEALVAALLHLGRHERKTEIIGARALDRLIFEGPRAVDFCLVEPVEKQLEILFASRPESRR